MLHIELQHARPGMTLALPVPNPQAPERTLLTTGYRLTEPMIARMRSLGVHDVLIRYPGLHELDRYINPHLLQHRRRLVADLKNAFEHVQNEATADLPYERYLKRMAALVEDMLQNRASLLFIDQVRETDSRLLDHSAAVAYLSLMTALQLDGYLIHERRRLVPRHAREISNLGVGAMLHDMGTLHLPPEVRDRHERTGDDDDPAWRAHTRLGHKLVRPHVEPSAAIVVLDHHQRFNGGGFPQRVGLDGVPTAPAGRDIHIFARIAAVADAFTELRRPPHGRPIPAVRALGMMLRRPRVHTFDPRILRALLHVVPPYAPGSPVRLNDGRWGVPIDYNPAEPCRPRIHAGVHPIDAATDQADTADDRPVRGEVVDLRVRRDLHIVMAEGEHVAADNFTPPEPKANQAPDSRRLAASV